MAGVLMLMACGADAQVAQREPVCFAERSGAALITRVSFPDGYSVEGPWQITEMVKPGTRTVSAVLDHIIETRPLSGARQSMALPHVIEMTFSGPTMDDVLEEAATLWCETVLQARPLPSAPPVIDERVPITFM